MASTITQWAWVRVHLILQGVLAGLLTGGIGISLFIVIGANPLQASERIFVFAVGGFGVSLLGWAGSIMAGTGIENLQQYLDTSYDWSETDSRRAMGVLSGVGIGGMLIATLVIWIVW